jgi:hypothetical protein
LVRISPKYRRLHQTGKVPITNWHAFGPESEHKEGDRYHAVVNKGPETQDTFVRRILGKDKSERLPVLALNDEGHHCWRPISDTEDGASLTAEERQALKDEAEEARVWLDGLDRINNCGLAGAGKPGSRSRSICRQGRFTSRAAIIPRASPFRGWSAISGWRTRSRAGSSRFRVCRCSMPPDGRTPNFSAFGSASRNACNRVSPARNAVSRQAAPTPQPSSRGSARSWPCLGDGKWAGNSSSARRPRVIQNPSADFAQKALA